MKKTQLTNLIIVDASGSMGSKVDEVIGGLKQLFTQIEEDAIKDKKTVTSSTIVVDFSSSGDFRTLITSPDSLSLDHKLAENYSTRGMTALYDAISKGFSLVKGKQDSVFVNIITDGQENDSKEINGDVLKKLITKKKADNWVITFMGTTEQAVNSAVSMGVSLGNTMTFADSAAGVHISMDKLSKVRSCHYSMSKQMLSPLSSDEKKRENKKKLDNLMKDES